MRPLRQLDSRTLLAVQTALDNYQRHQETSPELARPFYKILDSLIGPLAELNIWGIRTLLNQESERRLRNPAMRVTNNEAFIAINKLGKREQAVLRLIAEGHRSEAILDLMSISYRTLASHKQNMIAKLGLSSARDLQKFATDNINLD